MRIWKRERIHIVRERDEFKSQGIEWKEKSIDLDFSIEVGFAHERESIENSTRKLLLSSSCLSIFIALLHTRYFFLPSERNFLSEKVTEWVRGTISSSRRYSIWIHILVTFISFSLEWNSRFLPLSIFSSLSLSVFFFPLKVISGSFLRQCLW